MRLNKKNSWRTRTRQKGQIAMAAVMFFLFVILVVLGSYATLAIGQLNTASQGITSKKVYATAESGTEDAAYRLEHYLWSDVNRAYSMNLNGVNASTAVIDDSQDPYPETHDYRIVSSANSSSVYRTVKMYLIIPDTAFVVDVKGALQIGSMGIKTGGSVNIQGNSIDEGKFYLNGSFISGPSKDKIEGDIILAEGFNNHTNPTVKTFSDPPDAMINLMSSTVAYDGVQEFIAPFTGLATELRLFLRSTVASKTLSYCYDSISIVGSKYMGGSAIDFPDSTEIYANAVSWTSIPIPTTAGWITIPLNATKQLISNEPYWIVIEQKLSGVCAPLVLFGSHSVDDLDQNTDSSLYYNDPVFYAVGPNPAFGTIFNKQRSIYTNRYILIKDYTLFADIVPASPITRDISFKLSLGDASTTVDGTGNYGITAVTGNVIAPVISGVDVWKEAFYNFVNTSPSPNTVSTWSKNQVIAGAAMTTPGSKSWENGAYCPINTYGVNSIDPANNALCTESQVPAYNCREVTGQLSAYAPYYTPNDTYLNYCQCVDGNVTTSAYCHDLDAPGNPITPILYPDKQVTPYIPFFTATDGPIKASLIKLNYYTVSGGSTFCYAPADPTCIVNWFIELAQPSSGTPSSHKYTYRVYDYGGVAPDTTAAPTGSVWRTGTPNTLEVDGLGVGGGGAGTTTFQLPAVINGNLDLVATPSSGKIELSSGPPNTQVDAETQPYTLWIKGNFKMRSAAKTCRTLAHPPMSGSTPIPDSDGNPTPKASIKIYVEGQVDILSPCILDGFVNDLRSYVQIISLNPGVGVGGSGDYAIKIRGSSKGSAYYATRGGILVDYAGLTQVRSLSANFLQLNPQTTLQYVEGLPDPYSEFGGGTPVGAEIKKLKETE